MTVKNLCEASDLYDAVGKDLNAHIGLKQVGAKERAEEGSLPSGGSNVLRDARFRNYDFHKLQFKSHKRRIICRKQPTKSH